MKKEYYIIIVLFLLLFISWMFPKQELYTDHTEEFKQEIDLLKKEVKNLNRELIKRYETIDTITSDSVANKYTEDFIKRTGAQYPPGFSNNRIK